MSTRLDFTCFISYVHGEADLGQGFVRQFIDSLRGELEQLVDLKVRPIYLDNLIKPGQVWPQELARALCHSACMVMIYSPVYGRRRECLREYEAMLQVEQRRVALLGQQGVKVGLIIPVVLRGFDKLPPHIKEERHAVDFSHFSLAEAPMQSNPHYVKQVKAIAERIAEHHDLLEPLEDKACDGCAGFQLPAVTAVTPWLAARPSFPGR